VRHQVLAAFGVYLLASLWLFGRPLAHDPSHTCLCVSTTTDEGIVAWGLEWWPHALLHGLNPFVPRIIYAPQGFDIAQGTLMPGLALVMAPVTAIAGPLLTFDIAALLAPPLAALFAFLLCRRLTDAFWPSLVGGWLFGFSSYMLGEQAGHLNLTLVFLVPAIVHLVVRAHAGDFSNRRFVLLLTLALVGQLLLSTEIFATMTLFALISLVVAALIGRTGTRAAIRGLLGPIAFSYLAAAVIVSPYLYYALRSGSAAIDVSRAELFSNDLLGFVVPTEMTRVGGVHFASTSVHFLGGIVEANAYLGLPLLVLLIWSVRAGWRRIEVRLMATMLVVIAICSLGARLHIDGHESIPLPWDAVQRLPLIGVALPSRFNMYVALIAAALAAILLTRQRLITWVLAVVVIVSLWPSTELGFWQSKPDVPRLFTSSAWRHVIRRGYTALVLPVGIEGNSMLWQAETRLGFTMASGYVYAPNSPDPYADDPIYPTLIYGFSVPHEQQAAEQFLTSHHVSVAIMSATLSVNAAPWVAILHNLGWGSTEQAGAIVFRPGTALREPTPPFAPPARPTATGRPSAQLAAGQAITTYIHAFITGNAPTVCALSTPQARAAQLPTPDADQTQCATQLGAELASEVGIRQATAQTRIGPIAIKGNYGYASLIAHGRTAFIPLRRLGGRWLIDGPASSI
jgi:hypothetical protein